MSTRATGAFEITGWDGAPYDEREGATLSRACLTKTYRGDLEGESTTDLLFAEAQEGGSGAYAGLERFVGSVHGRVGSFVLQHCENGPGGERSDAATLGVVPDSGTGELRRLSGEARIAVDEEGNHAFTLDYDLE